ncbi:MAG: hypothetical protein SFX73_00230 [Kofleriaceae bacterium]|nr:hypothetical protein [Kofleriaceae bacterium]
MLLWARSFGYTAAPDGVIDVPTLADAVAHATTRAAADGTITEDEIESLRRWLGDTALNSGRVYRAADHQSRDDTYAALLAAYQAFVDASPNSAVFTADAEGSLRRLIFGPIDSASRLPPGTSRIPPVVLFSNNGDLAGTLRSEEVRIRTARASGKRVGPDSTRVVLQALDTNYGEPRLFTDADTFAAFDALMAELVSAGMPLDVGDDDQQETIIVRLAKLGFNGEHGQRRVTLMNRLLAAGADPDRQRLDWSRSSSGGGTRIGPGALIYAALGAQDHGSEAVSALLAAGADPDKTVHGTIYEAGFYRRTTDGTRTVLVSSPVGFGITAHEYAVASGSSAASALPQHGGDSFAKALRFLRATSARFMTDLAENDVQFDAAEIQTLLAGYTADDIRQLWIELAKTDIYYHSDMPAFGLHTYGPGERCFLPKLVRALVEAGRTEGASVGAIEICMPHRQGWKSEAVAAARTILFEAGITQEIKCY